MEARRRIAWNLRRLRTTGGLSQEALSADSGVAVPYLSGIERGTVNPTIGLLERIAGVLGVDVAELLAVPPEGAAMPEPMRAGRKPKR